MKELLKRYENIKKKIKELEEEKKSIQSEVKLYMVNNNLQKHKIDNYNIYYTIQNRNNLNKEKLKDYISDEDLKKCYSVSEVTMVKILSDETLSKMKRFINN